MLTKLSSQLSDKTTGNQELKPEFEPFLVSILAPSDASLKFWSPKSTNIAIPEVMLVHLLLKFLAHLKLKDYPTCEKLLAILKNKWNDFLSSKPVTSPIDPAVHKESRACITNVAEKRYKDFGM